MGIRIKLLNGAIPLISVALLIFIVFSFFLFGAAGARVVLGIIFMSLPFYFLLGSFELSEGEKTMFSVLLGLTIFPSLVYIFGLVVPFRLGIAISFLAFVIAAFLLRHKLKRQGTS